MLFDQISEPKGTLRRQALVLLKCLGNIKPIPDEIEIELMQVLLKHSQESNAKATKFTFYK